MRYWMWWNDLVQGPFELDEIAMLKAFGEDLLVCMEDRDDWLPASRVADLSSALEQLRARKAMPVVPPPHPPKRPPTLTPLQGEFFGEGQGQQPLLESEDGPKGPFAFRPVSADSDLPASYLIGQATMPFHFVRQPWTPTAVIELPRTMVLPLQAPRVIFTPAQVIKESPIPKPEEETAPVISLELLQEKPSVAPSFAEPAVEGRDLQWLPWILGVLISLGVLGSAGYWMLDRYGTHSAIIEANRMESPKTVVLPAAPVIASPPPAPLEKEVMRKLKVSIQKTRFPLSSSRKRPDPPLGASTAHPDREGAVSGQGPVVSSFRQIVSRNPSKTMIPGLVKPAADSASAEDGPAVKPEIPAPAAVIPTEIPVADAPVPVSPSRPDPWKDKQNEAVNLVLNKTLPKSKITIGQQAKALLQQMHEKELIHAAETGERLYLPDKMATAALQEEGSHYRMYLNFMASQANGERAQARSYQFLVDLANRSVRTEDATTQLDLFAQPAELTFKHNPMATDIDSILGGVDTYNKHRVQLIIVKKNRRNRDGRAKMESAMNAAQAKIKRAVIYFRRTYAENALQNIAKAYDFTELLKGE